MCTALLFEIPVTNFSLLLCLLGASSAPFPPNASMKSRTVVIGRGWGAIVVRLERGHLNHVKPLQEYAHHQDGNTSVIRGALHGDNAWLGPLSLHAKPLFWRELRPLPSSADMVPTHPLLMPQTSLSP